MLTLHQHFYSSVKPQTVAEPVFLKAQLVKDELCWLLLERDVLFIRHVRARF